MKWHYLYVVSIIMATLAVTNIYISHSDLLREQSSSPVLENAPQIPRKYDKSTLLRSNVERMGIWDALQNFELTLNSKDVLSQENVCSVPKGQGPEMDGGRQIIDKIELLPPSGRIPPVRLLCAIYTYPGKHERARAAALTWGRECDGFLAFSTTNIPKLGHINLTHDGEESYNNMWQKVRSIWEYLYDNHRNDYDYFHLGGDDIYVIVPNLRHFLETEGHKQKYFYSGHLVASRRGQVYIGGGPGYTLSSATLSLFIEKSFKTCRPKAKVSYEDRVIYGCLKSIGVKPLDSRDPVTGEQRYHGFDPQSLYQFTPKANVTGKKHTMQVHYDLWASLPNQTNYTKYRLGAVSKHSTAFHLIRNPLYLARIHAMIHKLCPNWERATSNQTAIK